MIDEPDKYVEQFVDAGADIITVHAEVCKHLHRTIHHVIDCGAKVGVALNPYSPLSLLTDALPELNLLLIMTVNPGFGGQKFIKSVVPKISEARELLDNLGADDLNLEVDGGVSPDTAPLAVKAGADILVAGNSVFKGKGSIQENIQALRDSIAELISN
jgi:ribulose-phosphate 3-epimerase